MEIDARVVGTRSRIFPCISAVLLVLLLWLAWRVLLLAFADIMIGVLLCGVTDFVARRTNLLRGLAYALVMSSIVVVTGGAVRLWNLTLPPRQSSSLKIFQDLSDIQISKAAARQL